MVTSNQLKHLQEIRHEVGKIATSNDWLMSVIISNSIGCNVAAVTNELGIAVHWLVKEINKNRLANERDITLKELIAEIEQKANF